MADKAHKIKFAVITKASLKPYEHYGNWADEWAVVNPDDHSIYVGADIPKNSTVIRVKIPVFIPSEILILDAETGREIAGHRRKPSKWLVKYEMFDSIDEAIERAVKLQNEV